MAINQKQSSIKKTFEQLYGRPLSERELFNIKRNLVGFFSVLIKMDKQNRNKTNEQGN